MKKLLSGIFLVLLATGTIFAQEMSVDEMKALRADKQAQIDLLAGEVADIDSKIDAVAMGWEYGGVGSVGFGLNTNNNWFALNTPNSQSTTYGVGLNGFANLDETKYFWRNLLNVSASNIITKLDKGQDNSLVAHASGIDLSSLFGYKLNSKWAVSAEGKWTSAFLNPLDGDSSPDNFVLDGYNVVINDPGQLTLSAGVTWTPISNLVVLIHPLGYQKNWPGELFSSPGAKIGATYAGTIIPKVSWASNLSAFIPYGSEDMVAFDIAGAGISVPYDGIGDFVNWTWLNTFSTNIWKGIGANLTVGLRGDKQIWDLGSLRSQEVPTIDGIAKNALQSYTNLGLSYTF